MIYLIKNLKQRVKKSDKMILFFVEISSSVEIFPLTIFKPNWKLNQLCQERGIKLPNYSFRVETGQAF